MSSSSNESPLRVAAKKIDEITSNKDWKTSNRVLSSAQAAIDLCLGCNATITPDVLKRTGIGKKMKLLSKHQDKKISGYSAGIIKKWKTQVGLPTANDTPSKNLSPSLEAAKARLKSNYANHARQKDSRTMKVLSHVPVSSSSSNFGKKRKKNNTVVSVNNTSSFRQRNRSSSVGNYGSSVSKQPVTSRRPFVSSKINSTPTIEEAHERRQKRLRARAAAALAKDKHPSCHAPAAMKSTYSRISNQTTSTIGDTNTNSARKQMLAAKYPRIVDSKTNGSNRSSGNQHKDLQVDPELKNWFKTALLADMSEYVPAFASQGFDSIEILGTCTESDLKQIVPKIGHRRIISGAIAKMKKKRKVKKADDYFDYSEEEDGGGYVPGMVSALMDNRYAVRRRAFSEGGSDSSDMEASYDEIRREEKRSSRIGDFEDEQEAAREAEEAARKKKRQRSRH